MVLCIPLSTTNLHSNNITFSLSNLLCAGEKKARKYTYYWDIKINYFPNYEEKYISNSRFLLLISKDSTKPTNSVRY